MNSRTRGYLPHLEISTETLLKKNGGSPVNLVLAEREYNSRIEKLLDQSSGQCLLKDPKIARLVNGALRYFDSKRYSLHAWTIMPNHVYVLFTVHTSSDLRSIVHSWKSYTALQANKMLRRTGSFWQPEYFDRLIKSKRQFEFYVRYILNNPVKPGLCAEVFQWPWSGCSADLHYLVDRFV